MTVTTQNEKLVTLEEYVIEAQAQFPKATGEMTQLLMDITLGAKIIAREINRSVLKDINSAETITEPHSFKRARLEQFAKEQMYYALNRSNEVCLMITDDMAEPEMLNEGTGKYIVVLDPLDGTSNIAFNGAVATTFSIYRRKTHPESVIDPTEALRSGNEQVVGGYVLYGSSIMLVFTAEGMGVSFFTLDPAIGEFCLSNENVSVPEFKSNFSINTSFYELWSEVDQGFFDYLTGNDNLAGKAYSLRYGGSVVSDVHRILMEGGLFGYPPNSLNPRGKLHLMYKCNPLAFIMEKAGGVATNGDVRLLDIRPGKIHYQTPVFMGSVKNMQEYSDFRTNFEDKK
ncbi:MAG: fructose-1,6-bisphosphatase [Bacteroidetes bacterium]|nr:fructose-1,6-bisphosphatase [Bacteroidota bacterium]